MFLINSKCGMDCFLEISYPIRVTELCAGTDVNFSISSVNLYANLYAICFVADCSTNNCPEKSEVT